MHFDPDLTYVDILRSRADRTPEKLWMQEVDGQQLTFEESLQLASSWGAALRSLGLGVGEFVATFMENCVDSQHVWLGASMARSVEVPLSPLLRGESLAHALNDSQSKVLVIEKRFVPSVVKVAAALKYLKVVVLVGLGHSDTELPFETIERDDLLSNSMVSPDLTEPKTDDIACVLYTSGTTGPSKGALIPWAQITSCVGTADTAPMNERDAFYYTGASNHLGSRSQPMLMAMLGGRFVMRPSFKTDRFWSDIDDYECTFTIMAGAMAHFISSAPADKTDREHALKFILMVPVLPNIEEFNERFGVVTCTGYGMTELSGPINSDGWHIDDPASCGKLRVGWPFYEARLVDPGGNDVPHGTEGELLVRTKAPSALNAGYLNRPEATEEAWRDGWFHTGDVFRTDDRGNYYFIDRKKDAIRRSGENVSSFEVEIQITAHESVAECAAIAVPADSVEDEIKVFLVAAGSETINLEDLARFCAQSMPRFMVPRYFEVVEALPKTPTMRVQKAKLRERTRENEWDRVEAGVDIKGIQEGE